MKLATLCYLRRAGQTLMLYRNKKALDIHQGKWNGLGGKLEPGESPEDCAIREVFEESGLRARDPLLKGVLTFPRFKDGEDWYVFLFLITDFSGELIVSAEGDLQWHPTDRLLELNLWPGDRLFLPCLDQPGWFSGTFVYEHGELVSHRLVHYA
jgi:8-oxo-dGTP diphosphatase